jgi:myo-inositol 2-dehydrogenase / D-chiro-inositol 1-dehydrogenase
LKAINVGIIGLGRIGTLHADNIIHRLPQYKLTAVADMQPDMNGLNQHDIPLVAMEDLIAAPDIHAVIICSPATTHAPLIIKAAKAGKHIFSEKPPALNSEDIQKAIAAVDQSGTLLQVGFNRRFDPHFSKLKQHIRQGTIGTPHIISITSYDPSPPPSDYIAQSGGLFLDMAIHDFDMARFLAGSEITEVFASGAVLIDPIFEKHHRASLPTTHQPMG